MHYIIIAAIIVAISGVTVFLTQSTEPTDNPVITQQTEPVVELSPDQQEDIVIVSETETVATGESTSGPVSKEVYAEKSYLVPRRIEHSIQVSLTLEDDVIVDANITHDGAAAETKSHLGFAAAYEEFVIGENINTISLSRVGGASMTSDAFNDAVADIRTNL